MLRVAKGTVKKKATIKLYEEEINALYETVESSTDAGIHVSLPSNWTVENVKSWLMVHAVAANASKAIDPETDLFAQGFDRWVEGESSLIAPLISHTQSLCDILEKPHHRLP
ncbi:hypothetical protein AZE42_10661 [Rhizopogon vesiculosus]|uniref:Uncharacterized protein n=1 Tax=Rhizopogon vesiculosus TaxID=180088 RepID=A0A1J8Q895_9AGAM|nr:hypothetical protein AZE42_10661 [Rhizopogon vesiculosus]